jgi:alpha-1,3-glucosyltransferase
MMMMTLKNLSPSHTHQLIAYAFVICTCCKVLLFPSYYSTDFHVHRHWKAVTRELPIAQWYFDDRHVTTRHTLDYPPGFALYEYSLANNPVTHALMRHQILDSACLQLWDDAELGTFTSNDNDSAPPVSKACVAFMRSTVIVSDLMFWWGAWYAATATHYPLSTMVLLVGHPAFLWLDHVHFQYNGMLCGVWLLSLGLLLRGNFQNPSKTQFHGYHLGAAVSFACLLTLKHLYLVLVPWYSVYLFRRYCFVRKGSQDRFCFERFATLGCCTVLTLLVPFIPFLIAGNVTSFLQQLVSRLFPFQRGLIHDYWAGNLWAFYAGFGKIIKALLHMTLPEPSPRQVAIMLLLGLVPGAVGAWNAAARPSNPLLLLSLSHSALSSFMLGYHVHEKAILTTLLPLTLWAMMVNSDAATVMERTTRYGLLGLFPLLFLPSEMMIKISSYLTFIAVVRLMLFEHYKPIPSLGLKRYATWLTDQCFLPIFVCCILVLECLPLRVWGRLSFAPLAFTSLVVGSGLLVSWMELSSHMVSFLQRNKLKV